MRRSIFSAVLIVGLVGGIAVAQCDCELETSPLNAPCYTAFWPGQEVRFKLVVPAEYFMGCPECETVLITGWGVKTLDGALVYEEAFTDVPRGQWYLMGWDQKDGWGNPAPAGDYLVTVQTTAGEFVNFAHIVSCCGSPCCCSPRLCDFPCAITFGQPYVKFLPAEGSWCTFCSPLRISVYFGVEDSP